MKTNKIVMLTAMSIITVLPVIAISAVSCGKNVTNSSTENNPTINPTTPEEPIIPNIPTTSIDPIVQSIEVLKYFDRFEVIITGTNLSCDVDQYIFQCVTSTNQNEIKAKEIKNDSNESRVTFVLTDPAFQNNYFNLFFKPNNQDKMIYLKSINFPYFEVDEEQFNNFLNTFSVKMEELIQFSNKSFENYNQIYNQFESTFHMTSNTGIEITGKKELKTFSSMNLENLNSSIGFNIICQFEINSKKEEIIFKFWNPDPNLDTSNMAFAAKTSNGIYFIKDTIVGYDDNFSSNVTLSSELYGTDANGNEVKSITIKSIANNAFNGKILKSIVLPDTIENIGASAFANSSLMSIEFSDSLTSIGDDAFINSKLTTITLPNNLKSIGNSAFANNALTSVTLSNSLENIGAKAFENNKITTIKFPNSLESLGDNAFYNNAITKVDLSNTKVTQIPNNTFWKNEISDLVLNDRITYIGIRAFQENKINTWNLNQLFKNNTSIITIERGAFAYNNISLNIAGYTPNNIIYLPKNLKYLGVAAFEVKDYINFNNGSIDCRGTQYFDQIGLPNGYNVASTVQLINEFGEKYYLTSYDVFKIRVVNTNWCAENLDKGYIKK